MNRAMLRLFVLRCGLALAAWVWLCHAALAQTPQHMHTFTLDAPSAKAVYLAGEMTDWDQRKLPMQRGADGQWRASIDLAPGQWLYKFVVDGRWIADPASPDRDADGQGGEHSFVFIGAGDWSDQPGVPKGRVQTHSVPSAALGRDAKVHVYLPPGFDRAQRPAAQMPVLWLLHGWGMDADQWFKTGHIQRYMDKLLARGEIRPFVIVMPSVPSVPSNAEAPPHGPAGDRFLTQELPAWLAQQHGLRARRQHTAVAGMSWGGFGAVHLGLNHPRQYGLSYALSGAFRDKFIATLPTRLPLPMRTHIRCGRSDHLIEGNRKLVAVLKAGQADFTYREDDGAHTWHYWSQRASEMLVQVDAHFRAHPRPTR
jgi:enterochelin esterase-like enzyme